MAYELLLFNTGYNTKNNHTMSLLPILGIMEPKRPTIMNNNYLTAITVSLLMSFSTNISAAGGDPAKGKELSQTCAACHGIDGNSVNAF